MTAQATTADLTKANEILEISVQDIVGIMDREL